jgi:hypothetical protein
MVVTGFGFNVVFWDQCMRRVAVTARRPFLVPGMIPAFVGRIHDMTVVAGCWIIAEVSGKIADVQPYTDNSDNGNNADDEWNFYHKLPVFT